MSEEKVHNQEEKSLAENNKDHLDVLYESIVFAKKAMSIINGE